MPDIQTLYKNFQLRVKLDKNEFELMASYFQPILINKKEILVAEGKSNDKIYYVEKGLLFLYKTLDNGDTQVIQFAKENHWISDLYSFLSGQKSLFSVQALEDCELWALDKKGFDEINSKFPVVETSFRLALQGAYLSTLLRLSEIYSEDAQAKYNKMRDQQPDLLQRVPQYLIASYLGILPSSLSRIRNNK